MLSGMLNPEIVASSAWIVYQERRVWFWFHLTPEYIPSSPALGVHPFIILGEVFQQSELRSKTHQKWLADGIIHPLLRISCSLALSGTSCICTFVCWQLLVVGLSIREYGFPLGIFNGLYWSAQVLWGLFSHACLKAIHTEDRMKVVVKYWVLVHWVPYVKDYV